MPLYFFDTRDGDEFMEDDIGVDCPDLDSVKVEASRGLAELAREVIPASVRRHLAVEVRDDLGPVLQARLFFEAVILRSQ